MAVWSVPKLGTEVLEIWDFLGSPRNDFELLLVHMCCLCVKL